MSLLSTLPSAPAPARDTQARPMNAVAPSAFTATFDQISEAEWNLLLPQFDDASVYQSWAYGAVHWGESQLSHLVLRRGPEVAAIAQIRIVRLPVLRSGVAYLRWGPLWRRRNTAPDLENFRQALLALKNEYAQKRGLLLRLIPNTYRDDAFAPEVENLLREHHFTHEADSAPYRTLRLELTPSLELLRKSLDQKWRNGLNRAEKNGLQLTEGHSDDLYARFLHVYDEMMARKQFDTTVDVHKFRELQQRLPATARMHILLAEQNGQTLAATNMAVCGDTAIYLLGATSDEGMTSKASYLLQWRMIQIAREHGCRWYDLGGINPDTNPGVYHFKSGITTREALQLGRYQCVENALSQLAVRFGEKLSAMRG